MQRANQDWQTITQYVFTALYSIVEGGFVSPANQGSICPDWVKPIVRLAIFPVRTKFGGIKISALSHDIFIPDSELLNERFKGKVNLLNFGDNHIWNIMPVLRCSEVDIKYLSDYNDPGTMEVKVLEPASINYPMMRTLWQRRVALTR